MLGLYYISGPAEPHRLYFSIWDRSHCKNLCGVFFFYTKNLNEIVVWEEGREAATTGADGIYLHYS